MPQLTEDSILKHVTLKSYERGVEYHRMGAVLSLTQRGDSVFAEVQGSECEPYNVVVFFEDDVLKFARCSCPYDWEGYCKHVVASLLACIHDQDMLEIRPPIEELLTPLSQVEIRNLVAQLINRKPELVELVESFCDKAARKAR
jgi:uncharacterized Zn finger protein